MKEKMKGDSFREEQKTKKQMETERQRQTQKRKPESNKKRQNGKKRKREKGREGTDWIFPAPSLDEPTRRTFQ